MTDYPDAWSKKPHRPGCEGELYRVFLNTVHVDRLGRIGNGGIVTHDYRCNTEWAGCPARLLVAERAVRAIAVAAEVRP